MVLLITRSISKDFDIFRQGRETENCKTDSFERHCRTKSNYRVHRLSTNLNSLVNKPSSQMRRYQMRVLFCGGDLEVVVYLPTVIQKIMSRIHSRMMGCNCIAGVHGNIVFLRKGKLIININLSYVSHALTWISSELVPGYDL